MQCGAHRIDLGLEKGTENHEPCSQIFLLLQNNCK